MKRNSLRRRKERRCTKSLAQEPSTNRNAGSNLQDLRYPRQIQIQDSAKGVERDYDLISSDLMNYENLEHSLSTRQEHERVTWDNAFHRFLAALSCSLPFIVLGAFVVSTDTATFFRSCSTLSASYYLAWISTVFGLLVMSIDKLSSALEVQTELITEQLHFEVTLLVAQH